MHTALKDLITSAPVKDTADLHARYVPLVEFMGQAMGPNCEVVLHDLTVPDESIIAIVNSHISGRKVGGPVTDFALWFMKQGSHDSIPFVAGYRSVNAVGRICRSSSYFIRDESNELIGMVCVNVDITELVNVQRLAGSLIGESRDSAAEGAPIPTTAEAKRRAVELAQATSAAAVSNATNTGSDEAEQENHHSLESLRTNLESLLESMLDTALEKQGAAPNQMRRDERLEVVADLEEAGFFLLKGGIAAAAERLEVSEPTVYRDLVKVRS